MAIEVTSPNRSLGYYQVKHSGNNSEATHTKEPQIQAGGRKYLHFDQINNFKHSGKMQGQRSHKNILRYFLWSS
jgi:hypothetical protein